MAVIIGLNVSKFLVHRVVKLIFYIQDAKNKVNGRLKEHNSGCLLKVTVIIN